MENILGKKENLELFNADGVRVYKFAINSDGYWSEHTYDSDGNELTYKDSDGYWSEHTYDSNGNELTYKNSDGVTRGFEVKEYTMDELIEKIGHNFKIKK